MTKTCRAVIAEDEQLLRHELKEMLARLWPELVICAEVADGVEAVRALEAHRPEILFLDIQMPGMNGLEVARLASDRSHVVFVTAYDEHAVAAFEAGAADYVMKPFSPARLAVTVSRLRQKIGTAPANLEGLLKVLRLSEAPSTHYRRWVTASHGEESEFISVDEICYFQADNKYARVATPEREWLIRRSIRDLVAELDPATFWQIHRGTLVNVNAIAGMTRDMAGRLRVKLKERKETLPVSDAYAHLFKSM